MEMVKEMNERFMDWLNECPVQWFRQDVDDNEATYRFVQEDKVVCEICGETDECKCEVVEDDN